jgi:hypothetical protein
MSSGGPTYSATTPTTTPTTTTAARRRGYNSPRRRRGVVALLAMLFLVLIATLAVGLVDTTQTQTQVSNTGVRVAEAYAAAESGSEFMRYQLASMNLAFGTDASNLLNNTATALGQILNGTPNMGGKTVQVTAGAIYIPSQTTWMKLDPAGQSQFRATITQGTGGDSNKLIVTVRGSNASFNVTRGIQLSYRPATGGYALAGLNGVTMSLGAFTDSYSSAKGAYAAQAPGTKGSIVSNGDITLKNTAKVNGDARPGAGKQTFTQDSASVTGRTTPLPAAVTYQSVVAPAGLTDLGDVVRSSGTSTLPGGTYLLNSLNLSGTANIVWTGPVKLYIKNSYVVTGGATIQTYGNNPANRVLYFLPTCTTATWGGTTECVGELYAPDTDFTITGSVQLMGRITAKSINNSSTGGMHCDEALPYPGGSGPYALIPDSYREVP